MNAATPSEPGSIGAQPLARLADALAEGGLDIDLGLARLRVHSTVHELAAPLRAVYCHLPFEQARPWADLHLRMVPSGGLRRWVAPQARLVCDGSAPFHPFPATAALPLLEWGCNALIGQRMNHVLLFHAGALERDGRVLLLPALPGSGKSTLTAALSLSGWRLLSDEFGALDPQRFLFHAVLKPVALKNRSIDVIERLWPDAAIGPRFEKTRKGTVAHLAAKPSDARRVREPAVPGAVVVPRWQAGAATRLEPLGQEAAFSALAFNAFNYAILGEAGFAAASRMARECPAWQLVYSDLPDAIARLDELWAARAGQPRTAGAPQARGLFETHGVLEESLR